MMKTSVVALLVLAVAACGGAPRTAGARMDLEERASDTVAQMEARHPGLRPMLSDAYAYAVFPSIGKGGAIVGGAWGRGILYERGRPTGYIELGQASIGALLGGATFSELIVLRDAEDVRDLKNGEFDVTANTSVIMLELNAVRTEEIDREKNAIFLLPREGLMVDLSVSGQRLNFQPFRGRAAG
jgi:lipid-binding SYLF domain-containing protein